MNIKTTLILIPALLGGCMTLSANWVKNASDTQICSAWNGDKLYTSETYGLLRKEFDQRKLLDCDPSHLECASYGLKKGTNKYADCRMERAKAADEQKQLDKLMSDAERLQKNQLHHQRFYGTR